MNDLVLKGGRVVDPSQGLDRVTDIAFANGKVAAIGDNLSGKDSRSVAGKIVSPGLIRPGSKSRDAGAAIYHPLVDLIRHGRT